MGRSRGSSHGGAQGGGEEDPLTFGARTKRRRVATAVDVPENVITGLADTKRAMYHCNYCQKDISGTVRIKCAKCPDFDLCVECFSVGVEITPHKSNHAYRVMDNLSFPLISPDWTADEDVLLLEGVEIYGLGNWTEVADHVGTKSKEACFDHYMSAYINSPYSPLPDMSRANGKTKAELAAMVKEERLLKKGALLNGKDTSASTGRADSMASPSVKSEAGRDEEEMGNGAAVASKGGNKVPSGGASSLAAVKSEGAQDGGKRANAGPGEMEAARGAMKVGAVKEGSSDGGGGSAGAGRLCASDSHGQSRRSLGGKKPKAAHEDVKIQLTDQSGYNPKRDEFEPEYDNDAELPLAEMEFRDTDTELEREVKLTMLHVYCKRLDERKWRKEFILERKLLNIKKQQALDRKRSKEERELWQRARVFARFHSQEEHEALLNGLTAERRIRQRIEELQEYRTRGLRTLAEAEAYDSQKKKRETEASLRKARESAAYLYSGKSSHRANRYLNRERTGDGTAGIPAAGVDAGGALPAGVAGSQRESQKFALRGERGGSAGSAGTPLAGPSTGGNIPMSSMAVLSSLSSKGARKGGAILDVNAHLGADLLSEKEKELCSQCRLLPVHYLKMKEALIKKSVISGYVVRSEAYTMFKVDPLKLDRIYDFFLSKGWIPGDPNLGSTGGQVAAATPNAANAGPQDQVSQEGNVGKPGPLQRGGGAGGGGGGGGDGPVNTQTEGNRERANMAFGAAMSEKGQILEGEMGLRAGGVLGRSSSGRESIGKVEGSDLTATLPVLERGGTAGGD